MTFNLRLSPSFVIDPYKPSLIAWSPTQPITRLTRIVCVGTDRKGHSYTITVKPKSTGFAVFRNGNEVIGCKPTLDGARALAEWHAGA